MGAFVEIGSIKINDRKNIVVSKMGDGKFAIAQQIVVDGDNGKPMKIFLKNSIVADTKNLKDIAKLLTKIAKENEPKKV